MTKRARNTYTCPRCGGGVPNDYERGRYPGAISRWDDTTEVCSSCGQEEALLQFTGGRAAVHPVTGSLPWENPPKSLVRTNAL